jgi:hypothetical protein
MADNVGYTPGTGALVAADEIAGVLHQRIKIGVGVDGVAVDVSSENPMPVDIGIDALNPLPVTLPDVTALNPLPVTMPDVTALNPLPVTLPDVTALNPLSVTLPDVTLANPLPIIDATSAEAQQEMVLLLTRMLNYLNAPQGYDKSLQRSRQTAIIESGTVTTVGTVSNVANQTLMGGIQAQILVNGGNMAAWQAAVRNRIT